MNTIIEKIQKINEEKFSDLSRHKVISVTKLIDFVGEPFNKEKQAESCALKAKNDPLSKYAGMTAEEIIAQWDATAAESRRYGDLLDSYTEYVLERTPEELEIWKLDNNFDYDERLKNNCLGFDQFYADIRSFGFEYVGREISVYGECNPNSSDKQDVQMPFDADMLSDEPSNIVIGRIDCLFYNSQKQVYLIVDWKTTDEIKVRGFRSKKLKGPAYTYEDCDLSKYIIQVQTYKNDLIKTYQLTTADKINVCICNLRKQPEENGKNYRLYKENVTFNSKTLDEIVNFSIKKRSLLKSLEKKEKTDN